MRNIFFSLLQFFMLCVPLHLFAQDYVYPSIDPIAVVINDDGTEEETTDFSGSAPLRVRFLPRVSDAGSCSVYYEWRFFTEDKSADEPYLVRHEEETELVFTKDGRHNVILIAYFVEGTDTIARFDTDYWEEVTPIHITIEKSKLEFPNAFSPNGDGVNDIYRAKSDYSSIVEFKATIYSRWGQKIYEWTNPAEGWDGTFNGRDVKQGVYYVHVVAKGADGKTYDIKRDVNLLRGFNKE